MTPTPTSYARHEHHDFGAASRAALADAPLQAALVRLTGTLLAANRRGFAALADSSRLRDHAKHIKEHTLAHLDKYLEQLEASVVRHGGQVHWAATAADARQIVLDIAKQTNCRRVVKSKSMTAEEIHLNPALEAAGLEVTETDFGEFIIQLAGERPAHLGAPAARASTWTTTPPRWPSSAAGCCARSSPRRTWASAAPTSRWPRRARSC